MLTPAPYSYEAPKEPELFICTCPVVPAGLVVNEISSILGFVPSSPLADNIFQPLSVVPHVTLVPEPETYWNSTVYPPVVPFLT